MWRAQAISRWEWVLLHTCRCNIIKSIWWNALLVFSSLRYKQRFFFFYLSRFLTDSSYYCIVCPIKRDSETQICSACVSVSFLICTSFQRDVRVWDQNGVRCRAKVWEHHGVCTVCVMITADTCFAGMKAGAGLLLSHCFTPMGMCVNCEGDDRIGAHSFAGCICCRLMRRSGGCFW